MYEIIKVNQDTMTVSARDLQEALEVTERFSVWISRHIPNFTEGDDYTTVSKLTVVGNGAEREILDYQLSVDMAKHICLMSRTEKGKQCRQYLIDLEKAWNTPEQVMARALQIANKTISSLQDQANRLAAENERMRPKEIFADAVATSDTSILVGELAKILKQNGIEIGQNRLYQRLRHEGYLISRNGTDYNMPTQRAMEMGLFEIKERSISNPDGSIRITKTTKVTGKGQQYFINRFLSCKSQRKVEAIA